LLFLGYGTEPLALARLAGEYAVLMHYLEMHHEEGTRWLNFDNAIPMTAGDMAQRLEREGFSVFPRSVRDRLHRFSHQDTLAMAMSVRVTGARSLQVGLIGESVRYVGGLLLSQDAHVLIRLHRFVAGVDTAWDRSAIRELEMLAEAMARTDMS
jgi:hypothetical protein